MAEQKLQVCFVLKGRDAAAFLAYKDASFLSADSEVARQLVLQRLAQIHHDAVNASTRRKPSVRSRRRDSDNGLIMLADVESENVA